MILSCPECSTRYLVDPAVIGAGGRRVRCAKCGHIWLQDQPEEPAPRVSMPPAPEREPGPEEEPAPQSTPNSDAQPDSQPDSQPDPKPGPRQPASVTRANLPALREPRRPARRLAWVALAASVVLVLAGAVIFRQALVQALPAAAPLYQALGLPTGLPGEGLALRNVSSEEAEQNGVRVLVVRGQVVNVSEKVRDVPDIRGALFDAGDRELQRWQFQAPESRLLPGEAVTFSSLVRAPPSSAVRLTVSFDTNG